MSQRAKRAANRLWRDWFWPIVAGATALVWALYMLGPTMPEGHERPVEGHERPVEGDDELSIGQRQAVYSDAIECEDYAVAGGDFEQCMGSIRRRYDLSVDELEEIVIEGTHREWPMP